MPLPAEHAVYTLEEYLRLEEFANVKHEYLEGRMWAMAGGTPEHGAIAMRIGAALVPQLRDRDCTVYSSDVRVRVAATGLSTYPDLSVGCGKRIVDAHDPDAVVDPVFLAEVLSPSTASYDRGEKLRHYQQIPTLHEVLLVAYERRECTVWQRTGDTWSRRIFGRGDSFTLSSLGGARIEVDAIYGD